MQKADIAEVRELIVEFSENLPASVDAAALGVRSKAPFKLLCTREALIWRTEELARNSCEALDRDDFAAAAIQTRAVTECAALTWKLMEVLENRKSYSAQELDDTLMRMLLGWKSQADLPEAFNVMGCIDRMDKKIPGVRKSYDILSEIAHPNWMGTLALYSKNDVDNFITHFGRGLRMAEETRGRITNLLLGSLSLFKHAYNQISELMPTFISELESLRPVDGKP